MRHQVTTRAIAPARPRRVRAGKKAAPPRRASRPIGPDALRPGPPAMPDLTLQPQVAQRDRDAHEQRLARRR